MSGCLAGFVQSGPVCRRRRKDYHSSDQSSNPGPGACDFLASRLAARNAKNFANKK